MEPMFALPPYNLGVPSIKAQSSYYIGSITADKITAVNKLIADNGLYPENTRLRKTSDGSGRCVYVMQASCDMKGEQESIDCLSDGTSVVLERGDHAEELEQICNYLKKAVDHLEENSYRRHAVTRCISSLMTGNLEAYKDSQRAWIRDKAPPVENIIGFVEPYRDPYGIRAEFEGIVALADDKETETLTSLVQHSDTFIRRLPWAEGETKNSGKGPFEKTLFDPPAFASIHALTYCSSYIFEGINLPNYNDIRQECGFKNVIIANRMAAEGVSGAMSPYVAQQDSEGHGRADYPTSYLRVVIHELLGHGTSKLLSEDSSGNFKFDHEHPPIDPLSSQPIASWYRPRETWTGQFEDLATAVDECRAELVATYLMYDQELLSLFGYNEDAIVTPDACKLAVLGLCCSLLTGKCCTPLP